MLLLELACARPASAPAAVGPAVGMTRRAFVDPDRLRWDGDGPRPLGVVVWYPTADGTDAEDVVIGPPARPLFRVGRAVPDAPIAGGRLPTVVLSHGTGGSALQLGWLAQDLAEHGFLVVGVHHRLSDGRG